MQANTMACAQLAIVTYNKVYTTYSVSTVKCYIEDLKECMYKFKRQRFQTAVAERKKEYIKLLVVAPIPETV